MIVLLAALAAAGASLPAIGGGFTVDSTTDANPGDGACASARGECTLCAAIQETNALPGADAVKVPEGTFTLAIPGADENAAATGDLDVTVDLVVSGAGKGETFIDGGDLDRVLHVIHRAKRPRSTNQL